MTSRASRFKRGYRGLTRRRPHSPPGSPPGMLVADPDAQAPQVRVLAYGPEELEEGVVESVDELRSWKGKQAVLWINVDGLADLDLIRGLGELFNLHRLALEDVVNVQQRPKVEEYDDNTFIVTRMVHGPENLYSEQLSMFLGDDVLLTFQQYTGDCFEPVRERLRRHRGIIRNAGADYLAYALLDAVIDSYFPVLESFGEQLEQLEDAVIDKPRNEHAAEIHGMKRNLLALRRAIWPQREMIHMLSRDASRHVTDQTRLYLRDCYDHTIQLMDVLETYREIASGLVDVYLSSVSARTNEIMKVLTIIATIFIPLGFVASLYGMNFDPGVSPWNMPELQWYWGYPYALGLMLCIALGLLGYFWRRGWLFASRPPEHLERN